MTLGVLKVGALTLNENYNIADATNAQSGVRTVNISGIETYPGRTLEQVRALADDLTSMYGKTVPVVFQHKTDRSGYYTIEDVNTSAVHWDGEASGFTWSLGLTRLGPDNAVDIESRMTYAVRNNVAGGERWHAPPIGHHTYYVGAVTPATVVRTGADGPITVYRSIPAVNPRYGCPVTSFTAGRVRFLSGGIERTGERIAAPSNGWELSNGLVRVKPSPGTAAFTTFLVAMYDGSAWREKAWDVRIAGDPLRPDLDFLGLVLLRNDPQMVAIRILGKSPSTGNRVLIDLVLRRGSRFVEGYIQCTTSGQISVQLDVAEPFSDLGLYVMASGQDIDGIRASGGSSKAYSLATNGGLSLSTSTTMDFWIGAEVPKPAGVGGDPGFESGSPSQWSATGGVLTVVSGGAQHGTYFGRLTATGGTEARIEMGYDAPAAVGKQYTIAGWVRSPVGLSAGAAMLRLRWYNGGTPLSTSDIAAPALSANVWTPVIGTATAPASTTLVGRQAALPGTPTASAILDVDSVTIREAIDSGDSAGAMQNQYIMAASEATMAVAR